MTAPTPSLGSLTAGPTSHQLPINKPFTEWDAEDARAVLNAAKQDGPGIDGYLASRDYIVRRDPWRNGVEWKGPRGTPETETTVLAKVNKQFIPVDTINEVLDTAADALLERHPDLAFALRVPPDDPTSEAGQAAITAAKDRAAPVVRALRAWAEDRHLIDVLRQAYKFSRWATWAAIRAWVPSSKLDRIDGATATGTTAGGDDSPESFAFPTGLTLAEALDRIYVSAPEPETCVVYEDPETKDRVAIFAYRFEDGDFTELWWVDSETGEVQLRVLGDGADAAADVQSVDLLGWLPFAQLEADLLITDSVRRQQARQNFFESLLVRVGEQAGFPERYTLNAKPTGMWMTSPPSDGPPLEVLPDPVTGQPWYLHPGTRTLGSAITTDLVGITIDEDQTLGKKSIATPGVIRFDPVDPEYAIKAAKHAKQTIRAECKQGHLEMEGDATATGWSRVQARARFISDAMNHQPKLAYLLVELIEAVLGYARQMTGELAGFCEEQGPQVSVRLSPGPVSPEERTAIQQQVEAGLMARRTALVLLGTDDVDQELEWIDNSSEGKAARLAKQLEMLAAATTAGMTLADAGELVGFDPDQMALIRRSVGIAATSEGTTTTTADTTAGQGTLPPPVPGVDAPDGVIGSITPQDVPRPQPDLGALLAPALQPLLDAVAAIQAELAQLRAAPAPQPPPAPNVTVSPTINMPPAPQPIPRAITVSREPDGTIVGRVTAVTAEATVPPPEGAAA